MLSYARSAVNPFRLTTLRRSPEAISICRTRPESPSEIQIDFSESKAIPEVTPFQSGFILADGGLTLAVERGIDEGELPGRRCLAGEDAVAAAVKMEVFGLVADILETGQAGSDLEIHVGEIAVLGHMESDSDGRLIIGAEFEIDIAHGGVKGAGAGIGEGRIGGNGTGGRRRKAKCTSRECRAGGAAVGPHAGEKEHAPDALLEPRGLVGKDEDGTLFAIADEAHAGPDVDGPGDAVAALRDKEDAFAGSFLDPVDGCLNGRAIVGIAVAANRELIGR